MKRKSKRVIAIVILITIVLSMVGGAVVSFAKESNKTRDMATNLTYQNTKDIKVIQEDIDIKAKEGEVTVKTTYVFENKKETEVDTQAMLFAPNETNNNLQIKLDKEKILFEAEPYIISEEKNQEAQDEEKVFVKNNWEYDIESVNKDNKTTDKVYFDLILEPKEKKNY